MSLFSRERSKYMQPFAQNNVYPITCSCINNYKFMILAFQIELSANYCNFVNWILF